MSSLPLADCQIEIQRGLTTSSTAIFIPFTTQELYQSGKESLYYGLNALSNNLIMVDRKKLKNPNGLILGTPGSGKSFSAKREIANAFLVTDDDIIVNDPEGEYSPLVNRLKGQVIKISPNSTQFINPMDINANYSEEDNPLSLKADFILSLCELVWVARRVCCRWRKPSLTAVCISFIANILRTPARRICPSLRICTTPCSNRTKKKPTMLPRLWKSM